MPLNLTHQIMNEKRSFMTDTVKYNYHNQRLGPLRVARWTSTSVSCECFERSPLAGPWPRRPNRSASRPQRFPNSWELSSEARVSTSSNESAETSGSPTPGRELVHHADNLLDELERARVALERVGTEARGIINLSIFESVAATLLPLMLTDISETLARPRSQDETGRALRCIRGAAPRRPRRRFRPGVPPRTQPHPRWARTHPHVPGLVQTGRRLTTTHSLERSASRKRPIGPGSPHHQSFLVGDASPAPATTRGSSQTSIIKWTTTQQCCSLSRAAPG